MYGFESLLVFDAFELFDLRFPKFAFGFQPGAFFAGQIAEFFASPKFVPGAHSIEPCARYIGFFDEAEPLMPGAALVVADVVLAGQPLFVKFVQFIDGGGNHCRGDAAPLAIRRNEEQIEQRPIFCADNERCAEQQLLARSIVKRHLRHAGQPLAATPAQEMIVQRAAGRGANLLF